MLDDLEKTSKGSKNFPQAPMGLWQAVCVDLIDRENIPGFKGKLTHKVDLIWQLKVLDKNGEKEVRDDEGHRFQILKRYTYSLHAKANLCQDLEAWRGRVFDDGEKFSLESVVGANCQIQVGHDIKEDEEVKAVVQAIVQAAQNVEPLKPEGYTRWKDREKKDESAQQNGNGNTPF